MPGTNVAGGGITVLILLAAFVAPFYSVTQLQSDNLHPGGRQLQNVLAQQVADNVQDKWWVQGSELNSNGLSFFIRLHIGLVTA
jgi:hypothetical protein